MSDLHTRGADFLGHNAIRIENEKVVYFDPYMISHEAKDADIIFITHDHDKHFSPADIKKISNENTKIVIPKSLAEKMEMLSFTQKNVKVVQPGRVYEFASIIFETVPAYNLLRTNHPKKNGWVGYVIQLNGTKYYVSGDTDITKENKKIRCDLAFVPIGGSYTMNAKEAASLINSIGPKVAVPVHYEKPELVEEFKKKLSVGIECVSFR